MNTPHIARRYARALLELGLENSSLDALVAEMSGVASAYEESAEFREVVENPLVLHSAKKEILNELAKRVGLGKETTTLLLLLSDRRRLKLLPSIAQLLTEMRDERKGLLRAEVTTAAPLSDEYYSRLQAVLENITGQKIAIDKKHDESLIAGVVTRIGDRIFDGSLRSRLLQVKDNLLQS